MKTQRYILIALGFAMLTSFLAFLVFFRPASQAQVIAFLAANRVNETAYSEEYNCVDFSRDLSEQAGKYGLKAWPVDVDFKDENYGHVIVAFETADGILYVEPQTDDIYPIVQVGQPLCSLGFHVCIGHLRPIIEIVEHN